MAMRPLIGGVITAHKPGCREVVLNVEPGLVQVAVIRTQIARDKKIALDKIDVVTEDEQGEPCLADRGSCVRLHDGQVVEWTREQLLGEERARGAGFGVINAPIVVDTSTENGSDSDAPMEPVVWDPLVQPWGGCLETVAANCLDAKLWHWNVVRDLLLHYKARHQIYAQPLYLGMLLKRGWRLTAASI
eukprot:6190867-Amphidinium_carterae.1